MVVLLAALLAGWVACGRGPSGETAENGDGPRIVSLVPFATLALVEFGLAERIVGVGEHDPAADARLARGLPRVGSFLDVDHERLAALKPSAVIAPAGTSLRLPAGAEAVELPHPRSVAEAADLLRELGRLGAPVAAAKAADRLEAESAAASPPGEGPPGERPQVLMAFGTSPLWASGPGTVNDDVLAMAGGVNALADAAVPALTLDEEALRALAPEVVLLLLPGLREAEARLARDELGGRLPSARVEVLTEPFVLLPGPNLAETIRLFRRAVRGVPGPLPEGPPGD